MYRELQEKEDMNRSRIQQHRASTKLGIEQKKKSVFDENLQTRAEIKSIQDKIKDTIAMTRAKVQQEKDQNFK
jgi:hypothetical protein